MAGGQEFPAYLTLRTKSDGNAKATFLAEINEALAPAEQRLAKFSSEAQRLLDAALSVKRNDVGSLDLGVDQLKAAAVAQQARATAAREVAAATRLAAKEIGDEGRQARLAVAATEALAIEEERAARAAMSHAQAAEQVQERLNRQKSATDAVVAATRAGTTANGAVTNSLRSMRVATVQAGQQLQDIGISLYSGQRASVVFAQQIPQLAFALSGLEGSANKTHDRIGRFATFLSGPWGLAVGLGIGVIAQLITSLFSAGEASDKTGSALDQLSNKLDLSKNSYESLIAVVREYNDAQSKSEALTYAAIIAAEKLAQANLQVAKSELAKLQATPYSGNGSNASTALYYGNQSLLSSGAHPAQRRVEQLEKELRESNIAASTERARVRTDPRIGIETAYDTQTIRVQEMRRRGEISERQLDLATTALAKARKDALKDYDARQKDANRKAKPDDTRIEAFGNPLSPGSYSKSSGYGVDRGTHKHAGVDLSARTGTPVYATQDGVVSFAGKAGAYGNLIKIGHGAGTETRYGHLSSIGVADKQAVKKGDLIGQVGSTGRSTGPHLHYEVRVNGKPVDPTKGKFPMDASKVAEEAEKAREVLQRLGDSSAGKIAQITDQFDVQPKVIDRSMRAIRELDETIKELRAADPNGKNPFFQQLIADAQAGKRVVEDALVRPYREMNIESDRRLQVQTMIVRGQELEAAKLEEIWRIEADLGTQDEIRAKAADLRAQGRIEEAEALERILAQYPRIVSEAEARIEKEHAVTKELEVQRQIMDAYLGAVSSARSELEAILSGTGKIANFQTIFKQLRGKVLTELIFGPALRSLEEFTKKNVFGESVDKLAETTDYASDTVMDFADAVAGASRRIIAAQSPLATAGGRGAGSGLGSLYASLTGSANDNDIVVMGQKFSTKRGARPDLSPEQFIDQLSISIVKPMLAGFDDIFGTKFFGKLEGVFSGAFAGYMTGGPAGGILGALKGIPGLDGKLGGSLSGALKGSQTGSLVSGIGGAFGINLNETGAQIGGAIGSLIPIPGGNIIGSIAGGLIGKLFKGKNLSIPGLAAFGGIGALLFSKAQRGGASVTSESIYAHANNDGITQSLNANGAGLQDAIKNIAGAFGATVGSYDVGLGRYKDYYQVSSSGTDPRLGNSYFGRDSANSLYDGLDAEAAMRAAVLAALQDGAIQGIKAGAQKLLTSGKDLDAQIQKALDFQGVFDKLKAIKDPVGFALDALDKEFKRLRDIFAEAGASTQEYAQLEELYGIERAKAIKAAQDQITGSLRALYEQLTIGDSGLSLRARLSNAKAAYDPLKARVAAGDVTAYDDFAAAAQTLLDLQRQIYGSQTPYFDLLAEITGLTKTQLDAQTSIADAAAGRDSPFSPVSGGTAANDNTSVVGAIGTSNDILNQININIANLGNLLLTGTGGISTGILPSNQAEYYF